MRRVDAEQIHSDGERGDDEVVEGLADVGRDVRQVLADDGVYRYHCPQPMNAQPQVLV